MELRDLGLNRYGYKSEQNNETVDALDMSVNPGTNIQPSHSEAGTNSEKEDAKNILTGTVITSCFFQTSADPSRVEISGNDMRLYNNTVGGGGVVKGDTASINFIRSDKLPGTFTIQQRNGKDFNLDNVIEMFYPISLATRYNYFYIGRQGVGQNINTNYIELIAESDSSKGVNAANGSVALRVARDHVPYQYSGVSMIDALSQGAGLNGAIAFISGEGVDGGVVLAWVNSSGVPIYNIIIDSSGIRINGPVTFTPALPSGNTVIAGYVTCVNAVASTYTDARILSTSTIVCQRQSAENPYHGVIATCFTGYAYIQVYQGTNTEQVRFIIVP